MAKRKGYRPKLKRRKLGWAEALDSELLVDYTGSLLKRGEQGVSFFEMLLQGVISVKPKQRGKKFFDTMLHEWLHQLCPHWKEKHVRRAATQFTKLAYSREFQRRARLKKKGK